MFANTISVQIFTSSASSTKFENNVIFLVILGSITQPCCTVVKIYNQIVMLFMRKRTSNDEEWKIQIPNINWNKILNDPKNVGTPFVGAQFMFILTIQDASKIYSYMISLVHDKIYWRIVHLVRDVMSKLWATPLYGHKKSSSDQCCTNFRCLKITLVKK